MPDFGSLKGQGLLQVSGSELKFKEYGYEFEGNVALDYLDSDNDGILADVSGVLWAAGLVFAISAQIVTEEDFAGRCSGRFPADVPKFRLVLSVQY